METNWRCPRFCGAPPITIFGDPIEVLHRCVKAPGGRPRVVGMVRFDPAVEVAERARRIAERRGAA
jgi:hypothetical protein